MEETTQNKKITLTLPMAIVIAGFIIGAAIVVSGGLDLNQFLKLNPSENLGQVPSGDLRSFQKGGSGQIQNSGQGDGAKVEVTQDDDPYLGSSDAPVVMIEFSDFQCSFCSRFFSNVLPEIKEKYIETGKVKLVYRDFAFLSQESNWAAEAANCARDQEKFWEYHDYLFGNQSREEGEAFSKENLKEFAKNLGLNESEFNSCLDSGKYVQEVKDDTLAGQAAGVSGTPTVFINGQKVVGAQPASVFISIIEAELK